MAPEHIPMTQTAARLMGMDCPVMPEEASGLHPKDIKPKKLLVKPIASSPLTTTLSIRPPGHGGSSQQCDLSDAPALNPVLKRKQHNPKAPVLISRETRPSGTRAVERPVISDAGGLDPMTNSWLMAETW